MNAAGFLVCSALTLIFTRDTTSLSTLSLKQGASVIPCNEVELPRYTAHRTEVPIVIDGKLNDPAWLTAEKSASFVDLIHGTPALYDTRTYALWDDNYLYIGFFLEEPNVAATLTKRDAPIYLDNDAELFIAGADAYYEFEINAFGTVYEVLFFWQDAFSRNGYSSQPEFDLNGPGARPFNGVGFKHHPRGKRIGFFDWDYPGLQSAVAIDGTLNDDSDTDRGWTVELALPWSGMEILARGDGRALPPKKGDVWRMQFFRFNTYKAPPPANDSGGWALNAHRAWDSHVPECFPFVEFK
jgi:hypothetical protein